MVEEKGRTDLIGIFYPEHPFPAEFLGQQVVVQSSAQSAQVEMASRRRSEPQFRRRRRRRL